jgi:hypothetical protein
MKKRELAAAISSLQSTVIVLFIIVLVGSGRVLALIDALTPSVPLAIALLALATVLFLTVAVPVALMVRMRDVIRRRRQRRSGPLVPRWRNGVMIWRWLSDTHRRL